MIPACRLVDLPRGEAYRLDIDPPVSVFHTDDGEVFAIDDTCTHEEASLSEGTLYLDEDEPQVECPKHGAIFEIPTGQVLTLPAVKSVHSYETKVEGDKVLVSTEPKP